MIPAQDLIEQALRICAADAAVVIVTDTSEAALRWANNSMTTNGVGTSRRWTVLAFADKPGGAAVGAVSSTSVDADDIPAVVRAAEHAAADAAPAEDAQPLIGPGSGDPSWGAGPDSTGIGVFDPLVGGLGAGFDGADQLFGFAHHTVETTWVGSTTGLRRRWAQPTGTVEVNGKRHYGHGTASAWVGAGTTDFTDVEVEPMLAELSRRLGWEQRRVDLPAGRYETLLPPSAVADLMIYLMWTMEGRGAHEGRNALARAGGTRLGEQLTALPLTLTSDPASPGLEYAPFVITASSGDAVSVFDNGMDAHRVDWVKDGAVNALAYPRAAAAEFGAAPTVPGGNLLLTGGGAASVDEMVAATGHGLLLTTLWYIREVDPASLLLTGLTRDGVYLVEDGQVTAAVNNFRFNESPLDLLRRATEAGATERTLPREWNDWFTRTAMPALRVPDFHMSSVSQAT